MSTTNEALFRLDAGFPQGLFSTGGRSSRLLGVRAFLLFVGIFAVMDQVPKFLLPWSIQPAASSDAAQAQEAASPLMPCPAGTDDTTRTVRPLSVKCQMCCFKLCSQSGQLSTVGENSGYVLRDAEHFQHPMKADALYAPQL